MIVYIGPLILGFLLGLIVGSRIKILPESNLNFTWGSYILIFIVALVAAYLIGPFPYYEDVPLASGFIATIIGIFIGKIALGRFAKDDTGEH
jgi:energy-converting hydrogenase B subunit J